MHTEGNLVNQTSTNGWQAEGQILEWIITQPLSLAEKFVYLGVVRRTAGYFQYTSEITSYEIIAELSGTSLDTVKKAMPKLIKLGYITKISTNQIANIGKVAYKYQLNMGLPKFPSLGNMRTSKEQAIPKKKSSKPEPIPLLPLPDVTGFVQINRTIYDLTKVDDPDFYSRKANNAHPTPYDLWKHLGKDKYAEPSSQTLSN